MFRAGCGESGEIESSRMEKIAFCWRERWVRREIPAGGGERKLKPSSIFFPRGGMSFTMDGVDDALSWIFSFCSARGVGDDSGKAWTLWSA